MTPSARLQALISLLKILDDSEKPADNVASTFFRERRFIGSKDRRFVAERYYDILRHIKRLSWWCDTLDQRITSRGILICYEILVQKTPKDDLASLFSGEKYAPSAWDKKDEHLASHLEKSELEPEKMPDNIRYECPDWAWPLLNDHFGDQAPKQMQALLQTAPCDLRVNTIKMSQADALNALEKENIPATPGTYCPLAIRLEGRPAVSSLKIFKDGGVEIQDEGSQLISLLCDARPGMQVFDFCAGAGGKTLGLGAAMQNKGRIVATDISEGRLKRAQKRIRRAGLHNIECRPLEHENDKWIKRHKRKFDRVLIDAPCSGVGAWRRNPDARWHDLGPDLDALTSLQASILKSAARLVKEGGRLIYATCSLLPRENDEQIQSFLKEHEEFTLVPIPDLWPQLTNTPLPSSQPTLTLTPANHGTDGFFVAVMERKCHGEQE